jgi:hypothetical protein
MILKRFLTAILAVAALAVLGLAGASLAGATASNGQGPPNDPPGQGECQHGNSGQECKPDPQPDRGKDCEEHGPKEGGVNEDHCLGAETTGTTTETTGTTTETTGTTTETTTETTGTTTETTETTTTATTTGGQVGGTTTQVETTMAAGGVKGKTKTQATKKAEKSKGQVKGKIVALPYTP